MSEELEKMNKFCEIRTILRDRLLTKYWKKVVEYEPADDLFGIKKILNAMLEEDFIDREMSYEFSETTGTKIEEFLEFLKQRCEFFNRDEAKDQLKELKDVLNRSFPEKGK